MSSQDIHTFEIDGTTFHLAPLKLKQSLKAQGILVEAVLPAGAGFAYAARGGALGREALAGLDRIDELVDIFAGKCEVEHDVGGGGTPKRVALTPFIDLVFSRRNAALLAWLFACVEWQFADFFDESGRTLLAPLANRLSSLMGLTGESGDLRPTSESATA